MLARYSHVRLDARRKALEALSKAGGIEPEVTSQTTPQKPPDASQVPNFVVDVAGIEPATPCLQSRCSPS
jgi:hypothetical protein